MKEADEHTITDARPIFVNHVKHKIVVRVETRNVKVLQLLLHLVGFFIVEEEITSQQLSLKGKRSKRCTWGRRVLFLSCCEEATQPQRGLAQHLGSPSAASTSKGPQKSYPVVNPGQNICFLLLNLYLFGAIIIGDGQ